MTEAQENSLRVLMQRLREEDPDRYMNLIFEVISTRFDMETIMAMRNIDMESQEPDCVFVVARGVNAAKVMLLNLDALKRQLDSFNSGDGDPGNAG